MKKKDIKVFQALKVPTKVVVTTCAAVVALGLSGYVYANAEQTVKISDTSQKVEYSNDLIEHNYTVVSSNYSSDLYDGIPIEYNISDVVSEHNYTKTSEYEYKNNILDLSVKDVVTLKVNVPEDGRYCLRFDYLTYDSSILPIEFALKVNGEFPFYEARRVLLESTWVRKDVVSLDRYGNEIVTVPDKLIQWENKYFLDASYRHSSPLELELKKGINEFEIGVVEGDFYLGNIYLTGQEEIPEYVKQSSDKGTDLILVEAELMEYRNDSSIRSTNSFDTFLTPYSTDKKVQNVIDAESFKDSGQKLTYNFTVEKAGYYNLGFAYRQSDKSDFPVFMDIRVDGKIPSTIFKSYPFPYSKDFKNLTVKDSDKDKVALYLEEGTHEISLTINIDNIRHVLEAVDRIMNEVNDLSLEITKVAGKSKDKYRDLDMVKYIPDIESRLVGFADELDYLADSVKHYNPKVKEIAAFSSIQVASSKLRELAKEPNRIPYRIDELAQSTNSVIQYLANLIDILNRNATAIDKIYIFQNEAKLPEGKGFFTSILLNIKRFFSSFGDQSYSTSNTNEEHLQVWVNRSRQHVEVLQKLIDESFTPATGIKVDVSIMPDQNKLILSNASGDAPDVAQSINYAIPFELGIRGAIKDVTEFDNYKEVLTRSVDGLHIPATIGDGIYAVPETINFWVLYYRSDILSKLGLEVPNTMEEVKQMLPELQMRGLNFYYPTAGMVALKTFHGTTPLLFQYGANLYGETAGNTLINSDNAMKGLTELTELFTIYNLPSDVPSFYQHFRNGDLPIGIAEYNMYNLLTNAAPEIANGWEIALVPGIVGEDGEIKRYSSGGAESSVIFKSTTEREEMAWKYLDWWSSTETQVTYGQTLQTTYGSEYIWNSANIEAFNELPWKADDKEVIIEQTKWMLESPRILGTYMLERELSDSYNKVVVDGKELRVTIDSSIKRINRETERKLTEFGYMSQDGKVIEEYYVPNIETVRRILNKK